MSILTLTLFVHLLKWWTGHKTMEKIDFELSLCSIIRSPRSFHISKTISSFLLGSNFFNCWVANWKVFLSWQSFTEIVLNWVSLKFHSLSIADIFHRTLYIYIYSFCKIIICNSQTIRYSAFIQKIHRML